MNDSVSLLFAETIDPVPVSRRTMHTRRTAMELVMVCLGRVFHKEMDGKTGRERGGEKKGGEAMKHLRGGRFAFRSGLGGFAGLLLSC